MQQHIGYYRFPTIWKDVIAFVAETDLWKVAVTGGVAQRLTKSKGIITYPLFSPNGQWIAYINTDEGVPDVYIIPADGGEAQRLTFWGAALRIVGWSPDSQQVLFASNAWQPFRHITKIYAVPITGGEPTELPYGLALTMARNPKGKGIVIGRNTSDYARWKRYRGGTVGVLWIDRTNRGTFSRLLADLNGNINAPMWLSDQRIYFLSDHEGIGNLYSCTPRGTDLRRHTNHVEFYARNATTDTRRIVYHAGGDIFLFDPKTNAVSRIPIELRSPRQARQRRFVSAQKFLEEACPHPDGQALCITTRGKPFLLTNWHGAVFQLGKTQGVRYRLTCWLHDKQHLVTVSDESGEEILEVYHVNNLLKPLKRLKRLDIGRPLLLVASPTRQQVAIANHRNELLLVDLNRRTMQTIDKSEYTTIRGIAWSPDGQWLAYSISDAPHTFTIKLYNLKKRSHHCLTSSRFRDLSPTFDPEGRYLYFLSYREFNPVYDSLYFDLGFPRGARPYLITLRKDVPSPFDRQPKLITDITTTDPSAAKKEKAESQPNDQPPAVTIDFENITERIHRFPVPANRYIGIEGSKEAVFLLSLPPTGLTDDQPVGGQLGMYHFQKQRYITLANDIQEFQLSASKEFLIYRTKDNRLRVVRVAHIVANEKLPEGNEPGENSGWIDLDRIRVAVDPGAEYQQIVRETWRLQREHFWTADMAGIDWERIYQRYAPLVNRITSRDELSDLIWELQGELGTSHAYEFGGDYPIPPQYLPGFLGIDLQYDTKRQVYQITRIYRGDPWNTDQSSPFAHSAVDVQEGDIIVAINGRPIGKELSPYQALINHASDEIAVTVARSRRHKKRTVVIKTLKSELPVRYREWVERNRQYVQQRTDGKIGYVHIPDMGPHGFAEFHRYFLRESSARGLIVDVRYNGGGHVSQLILEKLLRRPLAFIFRRWGKPEPYPSYALIGPVVAITNEYAGSDGDIFSHSFKMLGLGSLIGKRTWGGVVGISPRHHLVDGTLITQPEFSFWFKDVEWQVENYGTEPDIEVEITPQDWINGKDPQLDMAIDVILQQLDKQHLEQPRSTYIPRLAAPKSLPRAH